MFRALTEPNCKDVMNGKIIKKPKWVYGYVDLGYMHDCQTPLISDTKGNKIYKCQYDTIGQYTGLTDKNGTKIFEGDIIKGHPFYSHKDYRTCEVVYEPYGFYLYDFTINGYSPLDNLEDIEIIGNIHDNPELLGGAE